MLIEDNLRGGMTWEEARYDAMRRMGRIDAMKEHHRENRSFAMIESLFRDMHYAGPPCEAIVVLRRSRLLRLLSA
jgi:hypothetical protein